LKNKSDMTILDAADDCPVRERIDAFCSCPKTDCPRHGICCECILNHKNRENVKKIVRFPHCLREMVQEAVESGLD
jgi:hypothetical protein